MYWPSVRDDVSSVSPLARGVVCAAPRLFGRPILLDLRDLRFDSPSGSLMQPLSALIQPITDKLSRHVQTAAAVFNQSTQKTPTVSSRSAGVDESRRNPTVRDEPVI